MSDVLVVVAVLAAYNVIVNEVLANTYHGLVALATTALLWELARRAGLRPDDLGLDRAHLFRGLAWGSVVSGVIVAVIALVATVPATRENLDDDSVGAMAVGSLLWELIVRIPLVTAAFEEFAFRAVLLGLLLGVLTPRVAIVLQAVLFGLWHVLPTHGPGSTWAEVAVAVGFTTVAGLLFAFVRIRSSSLAAPVLVHGATNATTMLAAWIVAR